MGLKAVSTPGGQTVLNALTASGNPSLPILNASGIQIPSRLLVRQVMASPPTITTGSSASYIGGSATLCTIAGTVLTVGGVVTGTFDVGMGIAGSGVTAGSNILSRASGTGGAGTYNLSVASTVSVAEVITSSVQYAWQNASLPATQQNMAKFSLCRGRLLSTAAGVGITNIQLFSLTTSLTPITYQTQLQQLAFFHDGQVLEVALNASSSNFIVVKVDDAYVTLTPQQLGTSGTFYYMLNFGSVARRRIDIIYSVSAVSQISIGVNDSIDKAPIRGPRVVMVGDSFTAGAGASGLTTNNYVMIFSDLMGWDDVWCSGLGNTGYVANGGGLVFGQRIATDVVAHNPDIVYIIGSVNDASLSPSAVSAAFLGCIQTIQAGCPNAIIIASLNASGGVETYSANYLQIKSGMYGVISTNNLKGVYIADLLEYPLDNAMGADGSVSVPDTITLGGNATAGDTTINLNSAGFTTSPAYSSVFEFATGTASQERVEITSYNSGNRIYNLSGPFRYNHASGAVGTRVGGSLWTGHGNGASLAAYGNSNLYVTGADGIHPTDRGHVAIAHGLAYWTQRLFRSFSNRV